MAYADPVQRMAIYRGVRLGTELETILPGSQRLGGESSADIDQDTAHVSVMSPGMEFQYNALCYLLSSSLAGKTRQVHLHSAFIAEMAALQLAGLRFNDLVWCDDIALKTTVDGGGTNTGPLSNLSVAVVNKSALGTLVGGTTLLWIGSHSANQGFFARYEGGDSTHVIVDVPGPVYLGGVLEEEARVVAAGYDVRVVQFGYRRCRYQGQTLPEVQEGSQDMERFSVVYSFVSDTLPTE